MKVVSATIAILFGYQQVTYGADYDLQALFRPTPQAEAALAQAVVAVYRELLFRDPTTDELKQALESLKRQPDLGPIFQSIISSPEFRQRQKQWNPEEQEHALAERRQFAEAVANRVGTFLRQFLEQSAISNQQSADDGYVIVPSIRKAARSPHTAHLTPEQIVELEAWLRRPSTLVQNCAANALAPVLEMVGRAAPRDQLTAEAVLVDLVEGRLTSASSEQRAASRGPLYVSMAAVQRVAAAHGLTLNPVELTTAQLAALKYPAIASLDTNLDRTADHYVVVTQADAQRVVFVESDGVKRSVPLETFLEQFLVEHTADSTQHTEAALRTGYALTTEPETYELRLAERQAARVLGGEDPRDRYSRLQGLFSFMDLYGRIGNFTSSFSAGGFAQNWWRPFVTPAATYALQRAGVNKPYARILGAGVGGFVLGGVGTGTNPEGKPDGSFGVGSGLIKGGISVGIVAATETGARYWPNYTPLIAAAATAAGIAAERGLSRAVFNTKGLPRPLEAWQAELENKTAGQRFATGFTSSFNQADTYINLGHALLQTYAVGDLKMDPGRAVLLSNALAGSVSAFLPQPGETLTRKDRLGNLAGLLASQGAAFGLQSYAERLIRKGANPATAAQLIQLGSALGGATAAGIVNEARVDGPGGSFWQGFSGSMARSGHDFAMTQLRTASLGLADPRTGQIPNALDSSTIVQHVIQVGELHRQAERVGLGPALQNLVFANAIATASQQFGRTLSDAIRGGEYVRRPLPGAEPGKRPPIIFGLPTPDGRTQFSDLKNQPLGSFQTPGSQLKTVTPTGTSVLTAGPQGIWFDTSGQIINEATTPLSVTSPAASFMRAVNPATGVITERTETHQAPFVPTAQEMTKTPFINPATGVTDYLISASHIADLTDINSPPVFSHNVEIVGNEIRPKPGSLTTILGRDLTTIVQTGFESPELKMSLADMTSFRESMTGIPLQPMATATLGTTPIQVFTAANDLSRDGQVLQMRVFNEHGVRAALDAGKQLLDLGGLQVAVAPTQTPGVIEVAGRPLLPLDKSGNVFAEFQYLKVADQALQPGGEQTRIVMKALGEVPVPSQNPLITNMRAVALPDRPVALIGLGRIGYQGTLVGDLQPGFQLGDFVVEKPVSNFTLTAAADLSQIRDSLRLTAPIELGADRTVYVEMLGTERRLAGPVAAGTLPDTDGIKHTLQSLGTEMPLPNGTTARGDLVAITKGNETVGHLLVKNIFQEHSPTLAVINNDKLGRTQTVAIPKPFVKMPETYLTKAYDVYSAQGQRISRDYYAGDDLAQRENFGVAGKVQTIDTIGSDKMVRQDLTTGKLLTFTKGAGDQFQLSQVRGQRGLEMEIVGGITRFVSDPLDRTKDIVHMPLKDLGKLPLGSPAQVAASLGEPFEVRAADHAIGFQVEFKGRRELYDLSGQPMGRRPADNLVSQVAAQRDSQAVRDAGKALGVTLPSVLERGQPPEGPIRLGQVEMVHIGPTDPAGVLRQHLSTLDLTDAAMVQKLQNLNLQLVASNIPGLEGKLRIDGSDLTPAALTAIDTGVASYLKRADAAIAVGAQEALRGDTTRAAYRESVNQAALITRFGRAVERQATVAQLPTQPQLTTTEIDTVLDSRAVLAVNQLKDRLLPNTQLAVDRFDEAYLAYTVPVMEQKLAAAENTIQRATSRERLLRSVAPSENSLVYSRFGGGAVLPDQSVHDIAAPLISELQMTKADLMQAQARKDVTLALSARFDVEKIAVAGMEAQRLPEVLSGTIKSQPLQGSIQAIMRIEDPEQLERVATFLEAERQRPTTLFDRVGNGAGYVGAALVGGGTSVFQPAVGQALGQYLIESGYAAVGHVDRRTPVLRAALEQGHLDVFTAREVGQYARAVNTALKLRLGGDAVITAATVPFAVANLYRIGAAVAEAETLGLGFRSALNIQEGAGIARNALNVGRAVVGLGLRGERGAFSAELLAGGREFASTLSSVRTYVQAVAQALPGTIGYGALLGAPLHALDASVNFSLTDFQGMPFFSFDRAGARQFMEHLGENVLTSTAQGAFYGAGFAAFTPLFGVARPFVAQIPIVGVTADVLAVGGQGLIRGVGLNTERGVGRLLSGLLEEGVVENTPELLTGGSIQLPEVLQEALGNLNVRGRGRAAFSSSLTPSSASTQLRLPGLVSASLPQAVATVPTPPASTTGGAAAPQPVTIAPGPTGQGILPFAEGVRLEPQQMSLPFTDAVKTTPVTTAGQLTLPFEPPAAPAAAVGGLPAVRTNAVAIEPQQLANAYRDLGLSFGVSEGAVNQAYRALARQFHPNVNRAPDANRMMAKINGARDIIKAAGFPSASNVPQAPAHAAPVQKLLPPAPPAITAARAQTAPRPEPPDEAPGHVIRFPTEQARPPSPEVEAPPPSAVPAAAPVPATKPAAAAVAEAPRALDKAALHTADPSGGVHPGLAGLGVRTAATPEAALGARSVDTRRLHVSNPVNGAVRAGLLGPILARGMHTLSEAPRPAATTAPAPTPTTTPKPPVAPWVQRELANERAAMRGALGHDNTGTASLNAMVREVQRRAMRQDRTRAAIAEAGREVVDDDTALMHALAERADQAMRQGPLRPVADHQIGDVWTDGVMAFVVVDVDAAGRPMVARAPGQLGDVRPIIHSVGSDIMTHYGDTLIRLGQRPSSPAQPSGRVAPVAPPAPSTSAIQQLRDGDQRREQTFAASLTAGIQRTVEAAQRRYDGFVARYTKHGTTSIDRLPPWQRETLASLEAKRRYTAPVPQGGPAQVFYRAVTTEELHRIVQHGGIVPQALQPDYAGPSFETAIADGGAFGVVTRHKTYGADTRYLTSLTTSEAFARSQAAKKNGVVLRIVLQTPKAFPTGQFRMAAGQTFDHEQEFVVPAVITAEEIVNLNDVKALAQRPAPAATASPVAQVARAAVTGPALQSAVARHVSAPVAAPTAPRSPLVADVPATPAVPASRATPPAALPKTALHTADRTGHIQRGLAGLGVRPAPRTPEEALGGPQIGSDTTRLHSTPRTPGPAREGGLLGGPGPVRGLHTAVETPKVAQVLGRGVTAPAPGAPPRAAPAPVPVSSVPTTKIEAPKTPVAPAAPANRPDTPRAPATATPGLTAPRPISNVPLRTPAPVSEAVRHGGPATAAPVSSVAAAPEAPRVTAQPLGPAQPAAPRLAAPAPRGAAAPQEISIVSLELPELAAATAATVAIPMAKPAEPVAPRVTAEQPQPMASPVTRRETIEATAAPDAPNRPPMIELVRAAGTGPLPAMATRRPPPAAPIATAPARPTTIATPETPRAEGRHADPPRLAVAHVTRAAVTGPLATMTAAQRPPTPLAPTAQQREIATPASRGEPTALPTAPMP
ncbi:MAG: hypothetical protein HY597_03695, partial [Candidatus Omnitrophica bacterium]|nr:hypothetical protein [Candidatus Omnitrophota bacterium]